MYYNIVNVFFLKLRKLSESVHCLVKLASNKSRQPHVCPMRTVQLCKTTRPVIITLHTAVLSLFRREIQGAQRGIPTRTHNVRTTHKQYMYIVR